MSLPAKLCLALCCLASANEIFAACATGVTSIDFGGYNVADASPVDTVGSISIECDQPAMVNIGLGPSATSGAYFPRQMQKVGGDDRLVYNLYLDPSHGAVMGDGAAGTPLARPIAPGRPMNFNIYGRIPPSQNVSAGVYSDTLFLTILW